MLSFCAFVGFISLEFMSVPKSSPTYEKVENTEAEEEEKEKKQETNEDDEEGRLKDVWLSL